MDLTKDTLPSPESRRPLVPVECLGGTLYVRPISAHDGTDLPEETGAFLSALLMKSVVYADGTQVWTEESQALAYPMQDLKDLLQASREVNHITKEAVDAVREK